MTSLNKFVTAKATSTNIDASKLTSEQIQTFQANQGGLSQTLGKLMMVTESYPELKANQGFLDLQSQLEDTENRIAVERKNYNDKAQIYNTSRRQFTRNIIAGLFGFGEKPYFEAESSAKNYTKGSILNYQIF